MNLYIDNLYTFYLRFLYLFDILVAYSQYGGMPANKPPFFPAPLWGFIHSYTKVVYYKKEENWQRRKTYKTGIFHSYSNSYSR